MINKKNLEHFELPIPMSFPNNIIPIQDKIKIDLNQQILSSNITKNQKDFIIKTNKKFFYEFTKLYTKNILLKSKLNEILNEKKNLNQLIIKLEQQGKKSLKTNNGKNGENYENIDIKKENNIECYRKRKRIRRKKKEITYLFNCQFPNCNKSYPTKGSLNMHIKLKHPREVVNNFESEGEK